MKRRIFILFIGILIIINPIISNGENILLDGNYKNFASLKEDLRSYILIDFETEEILEEYNIDEAVEIASISKLMTYLVVMDEVNEGKISLDDIIIIDKDTARVGGSSFKLKSGEEFTVKQLLEAAIVVSGNDATYGLAKYVANTEAEFVKLMNKKAREIGLINAEFYNSTGLPVTQEIQNRMTTKEIFILSKYIIEKHPEILEISKTKALVYKDRDYFGLNTNPLLFDIKEVDGLKTGFTNKAGNCYVSTFKTPGVGNQTKDLRLMAIVMGAETYEERNILSKILVEHGLINFSNKVLLDKKTPVETLEFKKADIVDILLYPEEEFVKLINANDNIGMDIELEEIQIPIQKGKIVGKVSINKEGETIFQTNLLVKDNVNKAKWYVLIWRFVKGLFNME